MVTAETASFEIIAALERPGAQPFGPILEHSNGSLYGTTISGGAQNFGTLFRVDETEGVTTLHSFSLLDGAAPLAGLTEGLDGALYGTTTEGGAHGFGVVFKILPNGGFTKLVDFTGTTGTAKGSVPNGLVPHPNGNLYASTQAGGANGAGTIFSLAPNGTFETLLEFSDTEGTAPGRTPVGRLAVIGDQLFGVTQFGGSANHGSVFQVSTSGTIGYFVPFTGIDGDQPGSRPSGGLLVHSDGLLYGTTEFGGTNGVGVAFRISTTASPIFELRHTFTDSSGSQPSGSLTKRPDGSVFGTTVVGGAQGWGTIYAISPSGVHSTIAHFSNRSGSNPGASPRSGLTTISDGNIYGTTTAGGPGQRGLVFKISSGTTFNSVASFTNELGWHPSGAPIRDREGGLIFPVFAGGTNGSGVIAQITTSSTLSPVVTLGGDLGSAPVGALLDTGTDFVGITQNGSSSARGAIFKFNTDVDKTLVSALTSTAGESISGPLLKASDGLFYGVARKGGFADQGTVFTVDELGTLNRAFSFTGDTGTKMGSHPISPLVQTAEGAIYGLARYSNLSPNATFDPNGSLFKIDSLGEMTTLTTFSNAGPRTPSSSLTLAQDGKYYATTRSGGVADLGAIIAFDPATEQTVEVASFEAATTGSLPEGPLLLGPDGMLYGFATAGGEGHGTVFQFDPQTAALACLVSFTGFEGTRPGIPFIDLGADQPLYGGLQFGTDHQLYGVTPTGGAKGGGVVFRVPFTNGLSDWKLQNLGDANAPDDGDPDKDGLSTLEEYAFGTEPDFPDNEEILTALVTPETNGDRLSLSIQRDSTHRDIVVVVESANSPLGPWSEISRSPNGQAFEGQAFAQIIASSNGIDTIQISDPSLTPDGGKRFMRIRITR